MFDINNYPDKLAILYSGGADSTLMYYICITSILDNYPAKKLDLLLTDRFNKPLDKAIALYDKIKDQINDNVSNLRIIKVNDDVPGHRQVLDVFQQVENEYDAILWGAIRYPDDVSIRPKNLYTVNFDRLSTFSPKIRLPLSEFNKKDIVKMFIDLGIEDILNQTHSCGSNEDSGPCGKCFNCRERAWAYQQLTLEINLGI